MARKIKAQIAAVGTDASEVLVGDYLESDTLEGLGGDDTLIGMAGADTLIGGDGADTFVISPQSLHTNDGWWFSPDVDGERDQISDFSSAEGDKIDLSGLVRNIDTDGDFISEQYAVAWLDLDIEITADGSIVHVHQVAGDPTYDLGIVVLGVILTESDFILA